MADPCATIAGAISVVDVAIRCCRELHDGFRAMKGAPQAIKNAQTTLTIIQSVLEHTRLLAIEEQKPRADTNYNNVLSHVIGLCLPGIQANIEHLKKLLPSQALSFKAGARVKWLLDARRVNEIVKKLDSQQIVLIVELQIAAQEFNFSLRKDLLNQLHTLSYLGTANMSLQKTTDDRIGEVIDTVIHKDRSLAKQRQITWSAAGHFEDSIGSEPALNVKVSEMNRPSQAQHQHGRGQSPTTEVPTDSSIERILRAELERVVLPEIQDRLATFKADTDAQLNHLRQIIDGVAQNLESCITQVNQGRDVRCGHSTIRPLGRVDPHEKALVGTQNALALTPGSNIVIPVSRVVQQWKKSWIFRWRIGTLWITLVSRTEYSVKPTSSVQQTRPPRTTRRTYLVFIDFLPVQFLIKVRGLSIACTRGTDHRGYSVLCPHLTTFAVIPDDSLVMRYAEENDVEGLRNVLAERRAAPSDRNVKGETPLHLASHHGCIEACQLLLDEGADPLALPRSNGTSCISISSCEAFRKLALCDNAQDSCTTDQVSTAYASVVRMLHSAGSDLEGPSYNRNASGADWTIAEQPLIIIDRLQGFLSFLRGLNLDVDKPRDDSCSPLSSWARYCASQAGSALKWKQWKNTLLLGGYIFLELGADTCLPCSDSGGRQPLHFLFSPRWKKANSSIVIEAAAILLRYGADPCALDWDGVPVTDVAECNGWHYEWRRALERSDINSDCVSDETERCQAAFEERSSARKRGKLWQ